MPCHSELLHTESYTDVTLTRHSEGPASRRLGGPRHRGWSLFSVRIRYPTLCLTRFAAPPIVPTRGAHTFRECAPLSAAAPRRFSPAALWSRWLRRTGFDPWPREILGNV